MRKTDYSNTHKRMVQRLESESYFHEINSLDLSYAENEIRLSLEMNANNEMVYHLIMDLDENLIALVDFQEKFSMDDLVDSYISLGDFISGNMKYEGYGLGWGRLAWVLDNSDVNKRKIDMMVAFVENPSGIYDGSENYIKLSFGMNTVMEIKGFLKESYEIISNKIGL